MRLNRTSVGLKPACVLYHSSGSFGLNRTSVGLKRPERSYLLQPYRSLNRTSVGLKHWLAVRIALALIRPQSNQRGIETGRERLAATENS